MRSAEIKTMRGRAYVPGNTPVWSHTHREGVMDVQTQRHDILSGDVLQIFVHGLDPP